MATEPAGDGSGDVAVDGVQQGSSPPVPAELTIRRLVSLLERHSYDDWGRNARSRDAFVSPGDLVEGVLHGFVHDLLDPLPSASQRAVHGVRWGEAQGVVAS